MAGTITVSTISDGTNSTSSTNCIQGSAKAWVIFDATTSGAGGTPITTINAFNVSSVIYNSTGDFTINFTTAMPNANYIMAGTAGYQGVSNAIGSLGSYGTKTTSAAQFQTYIWSSGRVLYNFTSTNVVIFSN